MGRESDRERLRGGENHTDSSSCWGREMLSLGKGVLKPQFSYLFQGFLLCTGSGQCWRRTLPLPVALRAPGLSHATVEDLGEPASGTPQLQAPSREGLPRLLSQVSSAALDDTPAVQLVL